jgi:hypothetical protein
MPYRIIKKVRTVERPLVRSSDYAMNFGVDLDDEKTWKLYPLYSGPRPRIRGEVSQLLDANGNILYIVNDSFEFEVDNPQVFCLERSDKTPSQFTHIR